MNRTTAALAAAVIGLSIGLAAPADAAPKALPPGIAKLTPCKWEDGSGSRLPCVWDATKRGNGQGKSYWFDRQGRLHPIR